jgi:serine/threonine protein kinase
MRLSNDAVDRLRSAVAWPELPPDRYEIQALIGRGGMGAVYRARDRLLDREVAVKVSNAPAPGHALEARLKQEALVLGRLEHPGIVPVHDAGELADGRWFYVMKLVRGQTLSELAGTPPTEASVLGIFERLAETAAFAHAAGIVHRDLKPSNIMLGSFGEVLVLDWGVAKLLAHQDAERAAEPSSQQVEGTAAGLRVGTPGFMAPEQHRGDTAMATPASDVYSLGALLFWMLAGATPPATAEEASKALAARQPAVPRRLRAIAKKCLSAAPSERYADAAALVADLSRYRAGLAVEAHPESWLERIGRWFDRYRTFILLIAAYLVMRAAFAYFR